MMTESKTLLNQLLPNINNTVISFAVVAVCFLFVYYFFFKKVDSKKHQNIIRKRFIYIMLMIDVLILAKIWVDGFTHIFAMMSLVAAGLVVTNKEIIMNLVGGLVINWRELFVEGDFIQIQTFSGYVSSIGFMYFKIYETVSIEQKQATGRTIKIPNNLVITSPVLNLSPESNLCLYKLSLNENADTSLEKQLKAAAEAITSILDATYLENPCYRLRYLQSHNRELASLIDLQPMIYLLPSSDKTNELRIVIQFYCYSRDYYHISQQFWLKMRAEP